MDINKAKSIIESVLFANGDPLSLNRLSEITDIDKNTLLSLLEEIRERLFKDESSGIKLLVLEDSYQLCTKEQNSFYVKKALDKRRNVPLSEAALEVLAIIAYNQPVTRAYIEQIRGVECSAVIANLIDKSLIEEKGRLDAPGKPLLFGTTPDFLRCFNIKSLEELPVLPESGSQADERILFSEIN